MKKKLMRGFLCLCLWVFIMHSSVAQDTKPLVLYLVTDPSIKKTTSDTGVWIAEVEVRKNGQPIKGAEVTVEIKSDSGKEKKPLERLTFQLKSIASNTATKEITNDSGRIIFYFRNTGEIDKGTLTFKVSALPDATIPLAKIDDADKTKELPFEVTGQALPPALNALNALAGFISFVIIMVLLSAGVEKFTELIKIVVKAIVYALTKSDIKENVTEILYGNGFQGEKTPFFFLEKEQVKALYVVMNLRYGESDRDVASKALVLADETELEKLKLISEISCENDKRVAVQNFWASIWRLVSLGVALVLILPVGKWLDAGVLLRPVFEAFGGIPYQGSPGGAVITAFGASAGAQFWHELLDRLLKIKKDSASPPGSSPKS
ncbi:MAG: hypothetical protein QM758_06335 [Armatimonas sp.]